MEEANKMKDAWMKLKSFLGAKIFEESTIVDDDGVLVTKKLCDVIDAYIIMEVERAEKMDEINKKLDKLLATK